MRGYDRFGTQTLGAINPTQIAPRSPGAPTARIRSSSARTRSSSAPTTGGSASTRTSLADGAGYFEFDKDFTSSNGLTTATRTNGNSFAAFLLGYPVRRLRAASSTAHGDDAARPLHELLRRLRAGRLARQLEIHDELRPACRARRRHAGGRTTTSRSDSIRSATAPRGVTIPARSDPRRHRGADVAGGLMYAGVNGNPTQQGNPPAVEVVAARRRRVFAQPADRVARRLRAVLGAVQLSGAEHDVDQQLRAGRLHRTTRSSPQTHRSRP